MIRIYHFHDPNDSRFARAGRRGTWEPDPGPGVCPECGRSRQRRVPPLIMEWLPDSDIIGDFTWPGLDDEVVVTDAVRRFLGDHIKTAVDFLPPEMWQSPRLAKPQRVTTRTKPRVWLPYEGPQLWSMEPTAYARLDLKASGWQVEGTCSICGRVLYSSPPFEERRYAVDPCTWYGADIFRIHDSRWLFCTERAKRLIEARGFTNVSFLEDGVILD